MGRRAAGEGTIYKDGGYWVVEVQWTDHAGTHRRRRKRRTRTDAVAARDQLVRDIVDGRVTTGRAAHATVADAVERYLVEAEGRGLKPRTLRDYRRCCTSAILPALGHLRAHSVRRPHVTKMLERIAGARSREFTYVLTKAIIAPYVRAADPLEYPFPARSKPRVPKRIVPPFDRDLIARILRAVRGTVLEPYVVLALASGLRECELLGLTWGDVRATYLVVWRGLDEFTRTLGETKTDGSRRRNDLPEAVMSVIEAHRAREVERGFSVDDADLVFRNALGGAMHASNLRRSWRALRRESGIPTSFRLYDLRHSHASLLAEAGVASKVIAERLGHASTRLTDDTYQHLMPGMQQGAIHVVAQMLQYEEPATDLG
ncbi:MAG TPA: site-specific integrase [Candidatus Baltobacteraceae bacterium]|nr:site-specific integrase [Candidatus Baltobacteraceae bacterium]